MVRLRVGAFVFRSLNFSRNFPSCAEAAETLPRLLAATNCHVFCRRTLLDKDQAARSGMHAAGNADCCPVH